MAWSEDPTVFLVDFGVPVTAGAISGLGILDQPGALVADGMVISTDYTLRCEASKFGGLIYGAELTVDGINFQVRENRLIDDGTFCEISLLKLAPDSSAAGQHPRTFGLDDLTDVELSDELEDGEALVYDEATDTWRDQHVDAGTLGGNFDGGTFN